MSEALPSLDPGLDVRGPLGPDYDRILTADALAFFVELERRFGARRRELLERRREVQARLDDGWRPDFLAETAGIIR